MKRLSRHGTGTMLGKRGYILVMAKGHPRAGRDGYVPEHILVMEKSIGRYVNPPEVVHHIDGNPANNQIVNLTLCKDQAHHLLLHQQQRALLACGDASARKCSICGSYERQFDIVLYPYKRKSGATNMRPVHRECNRKHAAKHQKKQSQ